MSSWYGAQALASGLRVGGAGPESAVTPNPLAGFAAPRPVVTSLAGFAGDQVLRDRGGFEPGRLGPRSETVPPGASFPAQGRPS
jgi:hypothetical protein